MSRVLTEAEKHTITIAAFLLCLRERGLSDEQAHEVMAMCSTRIQIEMGLGEAKLHEEDPDVSTQGT